MRDEAKEWLKCPSDPSWKPEKALVDFDSRTVAMEVGIR